MEIYQVGALVATFVALWISYRYLFGSNDGSKPSEIDPIGSGALASRDILEVMKANDKNIVIFFGSQTGTAEDLASKLAKELHSKYGVGAMPADLDDYDLENLDEFTSDQIAIFLTASYGEGEPTDNAVQFISMIMDSSIEFSTGASTLENLQFAVFGLGNSTYEKFNKIGRDLNERLLKLGAKPVGPYGEGDDGNDSIEEDFLAWRDDLMAQLSKERGLVEREAVYEPTLKVISSEAPDSLVYLGEPLKHLPEAKAPWTAHNPYLAEITEVRELFHEPGRSCVHMEFELPSELKYQAGDHLAFWAQNLDDEVQRFFKAFGISEPSKALEIEVLDKTTSLRIPHPTTYEAIARYYLEINGPVSRQVLAAFAPFAPTAAAKAEARLLSADKDLFHARVTAHSFTLARLLLALSGGEAWSDVPFSLVIETIPHLQPRYYSISSSPLERENKVTVTAVVERHHLAGSDHEVRGVATNNILSLAGACGASDLGLEPLKFELDGPRGKWKHRAPVHIRHSNFKLPTKQSAPIIMVGPGTGVAPFRGFIQDRAHIDEPGKALMFFGSRHEKGDFLYADEWSKYSFLEVVTAFSRDSAEKVYVQHRLLERAKEVNELLKQGAYFYVCGDASRMARDVQDTLVKIISQERGLSEDDAQKIVRRMRSRNLYQEDVW